MLKYTFLSHLCATAALAALTAASVSPALAQETVLYAFPNATTGGLPLANLTADSAGNLYGTASYGGPNYGAVFEVTPDGTETVLYSFTAGNDGYYPTGGLVRDNKGNLFGTTYYGGTPGAGDVFEVKPNGKETVLYTFTGGADGSGPYAGLIKGKNGTLYGTTQEGGANNGGVVFELTKTKGGGYAETVLHSFGGSGDGSVPTGGLIQDAAGNLYGTTTYGGANGFGGTVFKLAPDGTETVLYSFTGGADGGDPNASLIEDAAGNLYSTTTFGGTNSLGVVFEVAPDGTETVLHNFAGGSDGSHPQAGVFLDRKGNIYGTTERGGGSTTANCAQSGCGVVFKLAPDGTETILHVFTDGSDGASPYANLIEDKAEGKGYLYGTAFSGGTGNCLGAGLGCGVVFKIKE